MPVMPSAHLRRKLKKRREEERKRKRWDSTALNLGVAGAAAGGLGALMLSPTHHRDLKTFANIKAPDEGASTQEMADFTKRYADTGHKAMQAKLFGLVRPEHILRVGRSMPFGPGKDYPWDEGDERHYEEFRKSPAAARKQMLREVEIEPTAGNLKDPKILAAAGREKLKPYKAYAGVTNRILGLQKGLMYGGAAVGAAGLLWYLLRRYKNPKDRKRSMREARSPKTPLLHRAVFA